MARAVKTNNEKDLRRVQTALRYSSAHLCIHDPASVLFSSNRYDWLFCLAAISEAQNYPLAKAAWLIANSSYTARNRLYRAFENERGLRRKTMNLSGKMERLVNVKTLGLELLNDPPTNPIYQPKNKYERASIKAIAELGTDASRKKLLRRADEILNAH